MLELRITRLGTYLPEHQMNDEELLARQVFDPVSGTGESRYTAVLVN
jgi:hypothetical protein